ncbi:MAG: ferritin family protein [Acidobacteria bacterium]|nr:ferritin family protein [Acidobacteriota bacterium]
MSSYAAEEFIQFAIQIEDDGEQFYRALAGKFKGKIAAFFEDLSRQEREHGGFFGRMAKRLDRYQPAEFFNESYFAHLRALTQSNVFDRKAVLADIAEINTLKQAIDFAVLRERASIEYYEGLSRLINTNDQHMMEAIIEEEQSHIKQLNAMLET